MPKSPRLHKVYTSVNEHGYFVDTVMGFCTVADYLDQLDAYIFHAHFYPEYDLSPLLFHGEFAVEDMEKLR